MDAVGVCDGPRVGMGDAMNFDDYQKRAARTRNHDLSLTEATAQSGLGVAGEAGEVADLVKKILFHGHPLDREKIREELGDVLWYVADLATTLNIDLSDVAKANLEKLEERYPSGFSAERSVHRKKD